MKQYGAGDIVLHNWKLVRLIGEGSFGRVFEAERDDFGTTYKAAVKIITIPHNQAEIKNARSEMDDDSVTAYFRSFVEEIVREFALMSQLKGTANVVSYEDHTVIQHEDGVGWDVIIRMELLTALLDYGVERKFTRQDVIKLGIDICRALELCQKFNILHRDIKPENIFVSHLGDYKLGDFGIARTAERTMTAGSKRGTHTYMAPEIYRGEAYGSGVDIYSLGIVLYRLLNDNRTPFLPEYPERITHSDRETALAKRISGAQVPMPKNADGRLAEIVLKACAYSPKDRYSSPMLMRQELEAILYNQDEAAIIYPGGDETPIKPVEYVDTDTSKNRHDVIADIKNAIGTNRALDRTESVFGDVYGSEDMEDDLHESTIESKESNYDDVGLISNYYNDEHDEFEIEATESIFGNEKLTTITTPQKKRRKWPAILGATAILLITLVGISYWRGIPTLFNWPSTLPTPVQPQYIVIRGEQYCTSLDHLYLSCWGEEGLTNEDIMPLRYMTNLTYLFLHSPQISDISPIAGLTNLTVLYLENVHISDIRPLTELTNLTAFGLYSNQISDITPLAGLSNLTVLYLQGNQISDITPLAGLIHLTELGLWGEQIRDISPLAELANLTSLCLNGNQISDITPLAGLTNLTELDISYNQISDLAPLAGLINLTELGLSDNQITDITPLERLTSLSDLWFGDNQVSDITPLAGLTNLTRVVLNRNPITDWSPVAHLENVYGRPNINDSADSEDYSDNLEQATNDISISEPTPTPPQTVTMPNVVGSSQTSATNTLQNQGFTITVQESYSDTIAIGNVISQNPTHGTFRDYGSSVTITVSIGSRPTTPSATIAPTTTITIPNVVGQTRANANTMLSNAGFNITTAYEYHNTVAEGNVISQNPASGTAQNSGAAITITISRGRETVQMPVHPEYITIRGEQYSTSLTNLALRASNLTNEDIVPLRYMINLTNLDLGGNALSDITPLAGLTNLRVLRLQNNLIHDISPLAGLTNLTVLALNYTPFIGWTNIGRNKNQIRDITPLAGLTNLNELFLCYNQISNLTPLAGLTNLWALVIADNQISDVSPLAGLTNLNTLILWNNQISNITPLAGLTNLRVLTLDYNPITDWSPVAHLEFVSGRLDN